jgi:hypothetical protein
MIEPLNFSLPQYKCSYVNCTIILELVPVVGAMEGPFEGVHWRGASEHDSNIIYNTNT